MDDLYSRVQRRQVGPMQRTIGNTLHALAGNPVKNNDDDLETKIALLEYRDQLSRGNQQFRQDLKTETPEGYATEGEIPKSIGGLPLEGVTSKGGRFVPSYKTPSSGMFGQEGGSTLGDYSLEGEEYLKSLPPQQAETIKAIAQYRSDPNHEFAGLKGAAQRAPYIEGARHYDSSYDPMEFKKRSDYLKDFNSGKRSQNRLSANTTLKHFGTLGDSLQDVPDAPIQTAEKFGRFIAQQAPGIFPKQSQAMTNEDLAIHAVTGELSSIFKASGGTDTEIGNLLSAYNKNMPTANKREYIKTAVELLNGRISSQANEYEQTMGRPYDKSLITPEAQSVIDKTLFQNPYNAAKGGNVPNIPGATVSGFDSDKEARYQAWKRANGK